MSFYKIYLSIINIINTIINIFVNRYIIKVILFFIFYTNLVNLISCTTIYVEEVKTKPNDYNKRVFLNYDYEDVFTASQLALLNPFNYPILNSNIEIGYIETDFVKSVEHWQSPHQSKNSSEGEYYKILIKLVKGKIKNNSAIKVIVNKTVERRRDFFSKNEIISSDGLEEMSIIYRIQRELFLKKSINKLKEKEKSKENKERKEKKIKKDT